jgi:membrane protease YdiL (CAAX protease family)
VIARARGGSLRERLGLVRGELGGLGALASVAGTLALSGGLAFAVGQLGSGAGESLGRLDAAAAAAAPRSPWLLWIAFGVAPGVCEELLFRGALQRSLARRFGAFAIGLAALAFALVHFDPVHGPAAFPLGLYLGVVALRARSTWPAMLCHAANNCAAMLPQLRPELALALPRPASWEGAALWVAGSGLALAAVVWASRLRGPGSAPRASA